MAWFQKKADPISDRARALSDEIAALEAEIRKLDTQIQQREPQPSHENPRLRSTALPHGAAPHRVPDPPLPASARPRGESEPKSGPPPRPTPAEPIFEEVDKDRLNARVGETVTREHFNELGVRKYDLPALLQKLRQHFRGPATTNPKLVNYLAAGGIQGLRPMRYEKRVARNRFIALVLFLFLTMLGIILAFVKHH